MRLAEDIVKRRTTIRDLIEKENPLSPITDQQLGTIIGLHRVTVAYHRKLLGIPRSDHRRVQFDYVAQHQKSKGEQQ